MLFDPYPPPYAVCAENVPPAFTPIANVEFAPLAPLFEPLPPISAPPTPPPPTPIARETIFATETADAFTNPLAPPPPECLVEPPPPPPTTK